jgi:hypothetical protein
MEYRGHTIDTQTVLDESGKCRQSKYVIFRPDQSEPAYAGIVVGTFYSEGVAEIAAILRALRWIDQHSPARAAPAAERA